MSADSVDRLRKSNEAFDKQLSPWTYAYKQVRTLGLNVVGLVGGGYAGWHIGGKMQQQALPVRLESLLKEMGGKAAAIAEKPGRMMGTVIGSFVGSTIVGIILGYEHWSKGEALRLSTEEINRDISETKLRMDPELMRENKHLREIVAEQEAHPTTHPHHAPSTKISADHAKSELLEHGTHNRHHELA